MSFELLKPKIQKVKTTQSNLHCVSSKPVHEDLIVVSKQDADEKFQLVKITCQQRLTTSLYERGHGKKYLNGSATRKAHDIGVMNSILYYQMLIEDSEHHWSNVIFPENHNQLLSKF